MFKLQRDGALMPLVLAMNWIKEKSRAQKKFRDLISTFAFWAIEA
jgi:hypothetical protein